MEPVTTVTTVWTIAKTAGEISKKLYELGKNLKDREAKQQVDEIVDKLRELKQSASELEDENREPPRCPNPPMPWIATVSPARPALRSALNVVMPAQTKGAASSDLSSPGMRASARASAIIISA
jgi:hypothetical protein